MKTFNISVQEDKNSGEFYLEFPEEVVEATGWSVGDELVWIDNKDGSFTLKKKDEQ